MNDSKLIDILRVFSPKQLKRFSTFVNSPFFNNDTDVVALFSTIYTYAPKFKHKNLDRNLVFKATYQKQKYDEKFLGYRMSDLVKLTEKFMAYIQFESDGNAVQISLLSYLLDTNLEKEYKAALREAKKGLDTSKSKEGKYYYNLFKINAIESEHFIRLRQRSFNENLQKTTDNLDLFYIVNKLKYSCEIVNRGKVVASDYELRLLDEVLEYVKQNESTLEPLIVFYYRVFLMLTTDEHENHFGKLKKLILKSVDQVSRNEAKGIYAYSYNYCVSQYNSGNRKYLQELFDLYKTGLNTQLLFEDKFLSPWTYKNIVTTAINLKELEWTKNFIEEYTERLKSQFRANAFNFNMAYFHFSKQEFDESLSLLNQVQFTDVFYGLNARGMQLAIYYEMNEVEPLLSLADSFKIFLRRNKLIPDSKKLPYANLIKFAKKLVRFKYQSKAKKEKLREEINETKQIAYKQWLLDKLNSQ